MKKSIYIVSLVLVISQISSAECGGDFSSFKEGIRAEALSKGLDENAINSVLASVSVPNQSVLDADRSQGVFRKVFSDFTKRLVSDDRLLAGRGKLGSYENLFDQVESEFGVPREIITAFWGLETDFGGYQGNYNTVSSLLTLAHDCRRPELFRPQVFGAIELTQKGDLDPLNTTGAWAGEIGQVQMLPNDILSYGTDGDGDGHVLLKTSVPDAIMSAGKVLSSHGWQEGKPWVHEVSIASEGVDERYLWMYSGLSIKMPLDFWKKQGVVISHDYKYMAEGRDRASLIAPQGNKGPKFLVYSNFDVFLKWNQSLTYTLSAAQFANMLSGAPWFDSGELEEAPLDYEEVKELQRQLKDRGHNVGEIDGIIGGGTRAAVRAEQRQRGFVSDGWPTRGFFNAL